MLHNIHHYHHPLRHTAGACSIIAGVLHATIVAMIHYTAFPPLETTFFIAVGLAQIAIGLFFFYRPLLSIYRLGLLINGGIAAMYVFLRFIPVPFTGVPEGFDMLGVIVLIVEVLAVKSSLAWLLTHNEHKENTNLFVATASACAIVLIGALGFYSSSMGMEKMFPERSVVHSHGHEDIENEESNETQHEEGHIEGNTHDDEDDHHEVKNH